MFEQLQDRFAGILKSIRGHGKITDANIQDAMRDVRRALLEADVNFKVARKFVSQVTEKAKGGTVLTSVTPGQQFIKIIQDELSAFLGSNAVEIEFQPRGITIILMAGLQGSGKTTTAAKLAKLTKTRNQKQPFLIAADLQRPAAIEQLSVLGRQIDVPVHTDLINKNPVQVVREGLNAAQEAGANLVIVDTAGRLHVDEVLMQELQQVVDVAQPHEILYVADGMTGQDAVNSSKAFNEAIEISGIVLTKMDGDSRGGAAVSVREVTGKPIKYIGVGEGLDALEVFHPSRLAQRILGMGDVVSLVEKAQDMVDEKYAERMEKRIRENTFTLEDFQEQLKQIQKMGSISSLMKMIPGAGKLKLDDLDDRQLKWTEAIISSMTPAERKKPDMINGSRRKRIAAGSGRNLYEVNQLLKQFAQMKKMMSRMGKMKMGKIPFRF